VKISGYMYTFQDLTPISGHFRTNFKISGISGQCPGLELLTLEFPPRFRNLVPANWFERRETSVK